MITPYIVPPRETRFERPLGPEPLQRVSPVQALHHFFPQASQEWVEDVEIPHQPPDRDARASDIMQGSVITVTLDTSLRKLVQLLTKRRISGVPVVDAEGTPAGVISLTDVAAYVGQSWVKSNPGAAMAWQEALGESLGDTPVSDVMSPFVYYAEEGASLDELAEMMLEHHIHRLVVVRQQQLVGIVSSLDLIRALQAR